MSTFYATVTRSQYPDALSECLGGCVKILNADNRADARQKMSAVFGSHWSFMYDSLDSVHPQDRHIMAIIP